jgi:hypothetical protein
MALNHKNEYYTQWTHTESGKVLNRRLHRIMVQRGDRGLVELAGPDLPDSILTFAGDGHKDLHEGYIYSQEDTSPFTPEFRPRRQAPGRWRYRYDPDWPMRRDVIHMAIGLTAIGVLKLIATGSVFGGF